jgi:hypothetical protein
MAAEYNQQYCKKHKQYYADFLHQCPICRGEPMTVPSRPKKKDPQIKKATPKKVKGD